MVIMMIMMIFTIKDTKSYVPFATVSARDDQEL